MIIDVHTHIGVNMKRFIGGIYPYCQSVTDLLMKMDSAGVDYSVVFPFGASLYDDPTQYSELSPTGYMAFPYQKENEYLLQYATKLGQGRLLPFVIIDPKREVQKQIEQIQKWNEQYAIYGVKLHTKSTLTRGDEFIGSPFVPLIQENNWPILFHSYMQDVADPQYIMQFALAYPDIRVGIAHLGGGIEALYESLDQYKPDNVFIDTSPFIASCADIPYDAKNRGYKVLDLPYEDPKRTLTELMERYGKYIMFGSDEPFTTYANPNEDAVTTVSTLKDEVDLAKTLKPEQERLLTEINPMRFLGICAEQLKGN